MEAVPRLPMISFELKISPSQPPVEFSKLKQYIREFYNEDPETYSSEIRNLEALRANAVRPVKDVTGCSVLKRYFCQLHFLQSRFPMGKGGAAAISFAWKDLYGGVVVQTADIKFEMVAILYNIGALHSQLGANDDRTTPEGLKMACTHFQCAAWSFQHLKDTYHQPSQMDLSPDLMQFMYHLCLAQAQECILEKSMTDNRKATINAKVAAQIVDYYNLALNALLQSPSPDEGILIDIVGTKNFKSWKKYMRFKAAYYSCVSLLYQGMQSEEQQKMGERVSYYQGALDKLNEAIKLSKGIDHSESVASACSEALVFTRDVVEGKRKAAKNENDFIYHEEIPELDSLPNVKGASLVKGISFSVNDPEISGPDIFARLVPMKAHEASSLYSEEKAKLLRKISSMIDSKDEELVSFMSCLQLEYIKAHLEPVILPQEVVDRCAALSAMPDAIPNLIAAMDKLNDAYHEVDGMLKEAMELIKEEEKSEKEYQELMGPRPPSIVATDLTREANKYMEAHKKAAESNETLHRAMTQHIENLRVLQQPLLEIQASLPNVSSLKLEEDRYLAEVILLVNKVGEMRRQRAMLASQLRESLCSDDITGQLVTRSDEKPEDIFAKELQKHDKYTSLIEQNLAAQDNIIRALTEAYANYAPSRKATTEIMRQRDMMLSALISSYDAYEDLIAKSSKGQEFYRKLETNLTKLLQRLKGTCKVQQEERETILAQNVKKAQQMVDSAAATAGVIAAAAGTTGSSNLIPSGGGGLKLKDYLQNKKSASSASPQAPPSAYYSSTVTSDTTPPQQSWLPGVRPAPVGSEGTAPVCTGSSKPSDYSSQVYNSMPNAYGSSYTPQSSSAYYNDSGKNYLQPSNYYYNSLYNTGLQSLQYPTISDSTLTQGVQDYNQNPYGYQQGTGTAASAYNYDHSYALSNSTQYIQNQSPSPSPSHTAVSNQSATQNSLSRDYSQLTSGTSNLSNQNYYGSHQSMPSHNGQTFSSHSYTQPVQVSQTYAPQPSQLYSQSQIFTQAPSQPTQTYSTPQSYTLPSSQEQSYPQQSQQVPPGQVYSQTQASTHPVQTYPQTQVSSSAQQQLGQPYSQTQSFLPQSTQPVQSFPSPQTSQTSVSQQPAQATQPMQAYSQPLTTQTQSIPSQSAQPLQNYSQSQVTLAQNFSQQPTLATQSYSPAHSTQAQTYVPASQPVGQEYTQATNAYQVTNSTDYSAYYSGQGSTNPAQSNWQQYYNYYNANQGAHQQPSQPYTPDYYNNSNYSSTYQQVPFQKTPGIDTSHYTRAGSKDSTLETNSSSVSPQGYTYASQYVTTSANGGTTYPQSYYVQPYGYNYTGTPTIQPASPAAGPDQAPNTNNITYMQAKTTKDNTSTTFSKQPPSNVDLLAGLDFSLKEPPLQPQQPAEKLVNKMSDLKLTTESNSSSVESVDPPKLETAQKSDINSQTLAPENTNTEVIERPSPSKTPSKDPFSDQEVLSQFVQEVEKFEKFVEGLNCKTLNGPTQLDFKWNELQDLQDKDAHKQSISVARCYPMKNRFADILPFDSTRVELPSTKDDYINASLIKDIAPNCPNFIMTQAPLPSTYADFWTMVLEQHVELIVCLLSEAQLNGEIYWAMNKTEDLVLGKIKVSLQSCTVRTHWIERIMSLSDGKASRIVIHLEFTSWPHSWLPESPAPLLTLCQETESVWSQQRGRGPIIVHCQSGVGRSGVLIVLILLLNELKTTHHLPEVLTATARLAKFRKNPLRDRSHLSFVYHCLLYHARDILMKRGILASRSSFEEKRPKTKSHTRHPSEDFLLNSLREHQERRQSDASSTGSTASNKPSEGDPLSQIDPLWPIKRYS